LLALTRGLAEAGIGIRLLVAEQATLEGLFFQLTEERNEASAVEVGS
jgi:hypothetical protein